MFENFRNLYLLATYEKLCPTPPHPLQCNKLFALCLLFIFICLSKCLLVLFSLYCYVAGLTNRVFKVFPPSPTPSSPHGVFRSGRRTLTTALFCSNSPQRARTLHKCMCSSFSQSCADGLISGSLESPCRRDYLLIILLLKLS